AAVLSACPTRRSADLASIEMGSSRDRLPGQERWTEASTRRHGRGRDTQSGDLYVEPSHSWIDGHSAQAGRRRRSAHSRTVMSPRSEEHTSELQSRFDL